MIANVVALDAASKVARNTPLAQTRVWGPYFRMLRLGVPAAVVENKVVMAGLEPELASIRDDMLAAFSGAVARDRIYVAAAGDISAHELGTLLDNLLGDLPATGTPQPPRAEMTIKGGVQVQDFPGPQSVVTFGQGGIRFDDPDYFAAVILNEVLGGGRFTARLMTEVREKRGLTYGISTSLSVSDHSEELMGQFQASNDKVAEAIAKYGLKADKINPLYA